METLTSCPICGQNEFAVQFQCVDYTVSRETFNVVKCVNCELVLTNPRPSQEEIGPYYKSDNYISHSGSNKGVVNKLYKLIREITLKRKLNLINALVKGEKSILDIGCGTAEFLNICSQHKWITTGIEPNEEARLKGKQQHKLNIYEETYLLEDQKKYAIITMWHVLEHVHNLDARIRQISNLLKSDGHLIIAVPNYKSLDAKIYEKYWAAYDVPRHLYHFDYNTITKLFQNYGFKILSTLPMSFDAYYVSLLSEKYQNGRQNYLKAIKNGFLSNLHARKNPLCSSSLIYILQKNDQSCL